MGIVQEIKEDLLKRTNKYNEKHGYDAWNEHVKYVVENAVKLAKEYGADVEIVELGALLHDISLPSEIGTREEHHIVSAQIAEELLNKYGYPKERIERVKQCVLHHRSSKNLLKNTIEEECVADADAMSHFDCIPMLFHLAYVGMGLNISETSKWVRNKLDKAYNKLSKRSKETLKNRYENIINTLFVEG